MDGLLPEALAHVLSSQAVMDTFRICVITNAVLCFTQQDSVATVRLHVYWAIVPL